MSTPSDLRLHSFYLMYFEYKPCAKFAPSLVTHSNQSIASDWLLWVTSPGWGNLGTGLQYWIGVFRAHHGFHLKGSPTQLRKPPTQVQNHPLPSIIASSSPTRTSSGLRNQIYLQVKQQVWLVGPMRAESTGFSTGVPMAESVTAGLYIALFESYV